MHADYTRTDTLNEAERFISLLCEGAPVTFQTFADRGDNPAQARVFHGELEAHSSALEALNQTGAGIFVTVNETDGNGRKAENITNVRALFVDLDGAPLPDSWDLEPHIVVESSPLRYHAYWLVDDCPLNKFTPLQKALARKFDGDPSVHDLSRVMRLPGFLHQKKDPSLTRIIYESLGQPYKLAELVSKLGLEFTQGATRPQLGLDHDPVLKALDALGLVNGRGVAGAWNIICPWVDSHTTGNNGTAYFEAHTNGYSGCAFKCQHAHCTDRSIGDLLAFLGVHEPYDAAVRELKRAKAAEARDKARSLWKAAMPARADHPYLVRKGISPVDTLREIPAGEAVEILGYVPKSSGEELLGRLLVVPVKVGDALSTLELIDEAGRKSALYGGPKAGGYWAAQPLPEGDGDGLTLLIGEGVATVLSAKEASGHPSIATLSSGNLPAVAKAMRERYPKAVLVILADLVKGTGEPDPHAIEAARAIGGLLFVPDLGDNRTDDAKDANDMAVLCGLEAVGRAIANAKAPAELDSEKRKAPSVKLQVIDLHDLLCKEIPPRDLILSPWLPTQSLSMIYSWRGVGKTHAALWLSYAVASGGGFLTWSAGKPRNVLFIDGEMPLIALQERLAAIVQAFEKEAAPGALRFITPDIQEGAAIPDLANPKGQTAIDELVGDAELIIIDNLSSLVRGNGRENESESWVDVQEWALSKRSQGKSVLFVHHSGKSGAQRGTSKREDLLDTVIALRRPPGYLPEEGAVFEIHYEKARGLHGDSVKPIEAKLTNDALGNQTWAWKDLETSTYVRVVALAVDGLTQREIADELGIDKSNVSRAWKKGVAAGEVKEGKSGLGRNQYADKAEEHI